MNIFPLILLLLADPDSAKLTLIPNTREILQRDNLLLLTLLENKSISAVKLFGELRSGARWFRYEIQEKGKWVTIRPSSDQLGPSDVVGDGPWLNGKSTYAETEALHRRSMRGAFLFETPGTYKIRAVATMPWGVVGARRVDVSPRKTG